MPAISVIMPIYNVEKYLRECLDSILVQTFRDFEVLPVDDGSKDSSGAILDEYAAKDPRVHPIHQANAGAAAARNNGMEQAHGKYLIFLDGDDFFEPDMFEKMFKRAEETGAEIVSCSFSQFDNNTGKTTPAWKFPDEISRANSCFSIKNDMPEFPQDSFFCVPWLHLIRKDFLLKYKISFQNLPRCNDMSFSFLTLAHADRLSFIDLPFVHYRVGAMNHLQSASSRSKHPFAFWEALSFTKRRLEEDGLYETFRESLAATALHSLFANLCQMMDESVLNDLFQQAKERYLDEFQLELVHNQYITEAETEIVSVIRNGTPLQFLSACRGRFETMVAEQSIKMDELEFSREYRWGKKIVRQCSPFLCLYDNGWNYTWDKIKSKFSKRK